MIGKLFVLGRGLTCHFTGQRKPYGFADGEFFVRP